MLCIGLSVAGATTLINTIAMVNTIAIIIKLAVLSIRNVFDRINIIAHHLDTYIKIEAITASLKGIFKVNYT